MANCQSYKSTSSSFEFESHLYRELTLGKLLLSHPQRPISNMGVIILTFLGFCKHDMIVMKCFERCRCYLNVKGGGVCFYYIYMPPFCHYGTQGGVLWIPRPSSIHALARPELA